MKIASVNFKEGNLNPFRKANTKQNDKNNINQSAWRQHTAYKIVYKGTEFTTTKHLLQCYRYAVPPFINFSEIQQ